MDAADSSINTTPLIDVMLVLLVMFILTLPPSTHTTALGLPTGPGSVAMEVRLDIDSLGGLYWNGSPVADETQLSGHLRSLARDPAQPLLRIAPERRAPYDRVARVLAAAQRSSVERLALAGTAE